MAIADKEANQRRRATAAVIDATAFDDMDADESTIMYSGARLLRTLHE